MDVWRALSLDEGRGESPDHYFPVSQPVALEKRLHSLTTDKRDSREIQTRGAWRNPLLLLTQPLAVLPGDRIEASEGEGRARPRGLPT